MKTTSTAARKPAISKLPPSSLNFSRLRLARLQDELSRCTYSEHGLLAVILPVFGAVCHLLIVVSYCRPGSAHSHAAAVIWPKSSRALIVSTVSPVVRAVRFQSASAITASMKASVSRTELLAFWY